MSSPPSPISISNESIRLAIKNIATFGDTDVFPYPLEKLWFYDELDIVSGILTKFRDKGINLFNEFPVFSTTELYNTGYAGHRPATQIDPLWNALFLSAVIEIAPLIEQKRLSSNQVFSYRFQPSFDTGKLFADTGWADFQKTSLMLASKYGYVASVDISDFYQRVYHHRLENVLRTDCSCNGTIVKFIDRFLSSINSEKSFGLPVGGPASRILAEALLIRTDRLLFTSGIPFIRFVDDYYLFGNSENELRASILKLNKLLLDNEGLSLNRNKTKLLSSKEHLEQSAFSTVDRNESPQEKNRRSFLSLRLRYDPYSDTADDDYEAIHKSIEDHDVLAIFENEIRKSRIDRFSATQSINAVKFMNPQDQSAMISAIALNLDTLSEVFPTVANTFRKVSQDISQDAKTVFYEKVRDMVAKRSPLIAASGTFAYAIRILADDPCPDADIALASVFFNYDEATPILQRDVLFSMTRRKSTFWLSNLRNKMSSVSNPWVRRAMFAASYELRDEGEHWRKAEKGRLEEHDKLLLDWLGKKHNGNNWELPI
ncbi:hypothetical protein FGO68_gene14389 [Halteria grandinella]|uniref:Reverse transcriptase domain-containing protein n=1 Tax=Halteria grandinella TaxID=5974 RepID=A0A8J8NAY8_HALGN|nr:hypothetical protein FGO68_gene14389 [Halteria grandinella]